MQMTPQSAHMMVPMWAIFGPLLKYYGFITAFSIDYTHFTQRMVPNRAAVQMSMQLVPKTFTQQRSASQREADTARGYIGNPHGTGTYHNRKNV